MDEFKINTIGEKLRPFLNEQGCIKKVSKESRQAVQDSMSENGMSATEHSQAMQIIQFTTRNQRES